MSLAILEFMNAGLAVLTSDLPSVCQAIDHGVTGLAYAHDDVNAAIDQLRKLIDDPALRRSLGAAAAATCKARYSLEGMNKVFGEVVAAKL